MTAGQRNIERAVLDVISARNADDARSGTDLTPELIERLRTDTSQDADRLQRQLASDNARLTLGFPKPSADVQAAWSGLRLVYWPDGIPDHMQVGVASSRLGRRLDSRREWFSTLRTLCLHLDRDREILVGVTGTAADRFVRRCAQLFDVPLLHVQPPAPRQTLRKWLANIADIQPVDDDNPARSRKSPKSSSVSQVLSAERHLEGLRRNLVRAFVSPDVSLDRPPADINETHDGPLQDRLLVALSDRLQVLLLRNNGNLHQLIRRRLAGTEWPTGSIHVACGDGLVAESIVAELERIGAVRWILLNDESAPAGSRRLTDSSRSSQQTDCDAPTDRVPAMVPANQWAQVDSNDYITHCTRRQDCPWPDQSEAEFLDDLILDQRGADHSAFAALWRILVQQRIHATADAIRGGYRTVSLADVPLNEWRSLQVYRGHRNRRDFEPYGIAIRREVLQSLGARPVVYGDDQTWESLGESDRPFFQVRATAGRDNAAIIDWTVEREWRMLGDLDLSQVPGQSAIVLVPSREEADRLRRICRWPMLLTGEM